MADEEAAETIAEDEKSSPKISQLIKRTCCNLNRQSFAKESDDENTPQGNEEEPNHEIQGMLIYVQFRKKM